MALWSASGQAATLEDLAGPVRILQQRLALETRPLGPEGNFTLALARAFGFHRIVEGQERAQDAAYFLPDSLQEDRLLAAFLTQRGVVPAASWGAKEPVTLRQALQTLGAYGRNGALHSGRGNPPDGPAGAPQARRA